MSAYENRDGNGRNDSNNQENSDNAQLFIAKGRNDGMDQRSLVDFIADETGIDQSLISNVKVLDAFSFFAVPHEDAGKILDFFQEKAGDSGRPLVSRAKRKTTGGSGGGFAGRREGGFGGNRDGGFRRDDRPRRDYGDRNNGRRDDY